MTHEIAITIPLDDQHVGPAVDLVDGSRFPRSVEAWATVNGTPVTIWLVVEDGRPVLTRVHIGRPRGATGKLKAATIHALPVDAVVRRVVEDVGLLMVRLDGDEGSGATALRSHGRRIVTDDLLAQVAAAVKGDPLGMPNQAVQRAIPCSSRTASRYITAARNRGFLDEGSK